MKCMRIHLFVWLVAFLTLLIVGCSMPEDKNDTDDYMEVREAAWNYVKEKGWNDFSKGNWQVAEVKIVVANERYKLLDQTYEGKEVLSVSFEDKENIVIGTPLILIDRNSIKVIGYMPSE
ncbi:hypothetical protein MKZ17_09965 [Solibacillus sp. FSL R7-0682]|uniref:hypothetical protein n=1 Tax=Solibacillus sp. FSL R7-0682 TaxID=2921690 RepID=UPI0030F86CD8